jgi:hypothetical protein
LLHETKSSADIFGCTDFVFDQGYLKGQNLTIKGCVVKLNNGSMIEATNILKNENWATIMMVVPREIVH